MHWRYHAISWDQLHADSRALAAQMLRVPLSKLNTRGYSTSGSTRTPAADLRKFLLQTLERHIEKKLITRGMLEKTSSSPVG